MDNTKKKEAVIEQLEKHKGLITTACKACKIPRSTFYLWMNSDPKFKASVDELMEVQIESVESKLFDLIDNLNPSAIIFYLKSKSKDYNDKIEITGKDGQAIKVNSIFSTDIVKPIED